ncbi:beta-ketoacyl-[acyl-carrier-protein] synthase II [Carnobacterium divergens]|uniref:3-oxoacyl-[acyl-carrier-protein] synthase 2 n=2 Tax=Carnobacterium divergens TaxID=2748 RepID=A0A0R2I164_CARDV|nr:beta-ketoacyl-ACP synthase II [Carnobacterium divergens]ANZ99719.1 beta-ketoacyl-[acyl-carrier-protein] synthase II [Carnobacterium divergens]KRN56277.1 3-oxoacyl-ACP synthase [Carnobacterium divergens DSM 20623]MCO6018013.1 beta-ketoacyl-ACP synthase II [Carnobacterium divergens]MDO0875132.1 beta-ketoacyl-ACP synthase II [Carnobacterium divergens]MDT1958880.1 beta-ketoacyl-ACP synthase II [Carnobacterium divergens]
MNRVVITGMGAVTPIGNSVDAFWESLKAGKNGVTEITRFDASETGVTLAAELKDFDATVYMPKKETKRTDLFSQYGIAAAVQAMENSGLDTEKIDVDRFGVIVSSGIGGMNTIQEQVIKMHDRGPQRVAPFFVPMVIGNMAAGNIAIRVGAKGLCTSIVTACASGTNSIGEAFRSIKHGYSDVILAGGTEATICEIGIAGFGALTALSKSTDPERGSIPFDKERNGFVMGEGAGVLVLEELQHALDRGAKIYGEVVGYGSTCDAGHMTSPSVDGSGAGKAMIQAMKEAGIEPKDVDYINAHGTSTPANDSAETTAIKYAMGEEAHNVPISSTKSMIGHLLGAAGAVEGIACVKALENDFLPPTIGFKEADEACDLDYIPNVGRKVESAKYALSNSLGFGGHNAVVCFKKWEEA